MNDYTRGLLENIDYQLRKRNQLIRNEKVEQVETIGYILAAVALSVLAVMM